MQAKYTLMGVADDVPKIPLSAAGKALSWARVRLSTKDDPLFTTLWDGMKLAISKELGHVGDGE